MFQNFSLIAKNTLRNRRRNLLTTASVAISLALLAVLFALYRVFVYVPPPNPSLARMLYTHHKVSVTQLLPKAYENSIDSVPDVSSVTVWQWFGGTYGDEKNPKNRFGRIAVQPERLLRAVPDLTISPEERKAFLTERTGCIASKVLAARMGWKLGDRITLVGTTYPVTLDLRLVGTFTAPVFDDGPGGFLFFNTDYLTDGLPPNSPQRDLVGTFLVLASSARNAQQVAQGVDARFADYPDPTLTETSSAMELHFLAFLGNLKLFLLAIAGAVTFTILLVAANSLSMSVRERTREIAVLKTLGFSRGDVLGIVVGEALLITLAGGALGCFLASMLCSALRGNPSMMRMLYALSVTPSITLLTLLVAAMVGFISALAPALRAAQAPIVQSLRYSG